MQDSDGAGLSKATLVKSELKKKGGGALETNSKKEIAVMSEKKEITVERNYSGGWFKTSTYYMPSTVFGIWHSLSP